MSVLRRTEYFTGDRFPYAEFELVSDDYIKQKTMFMSKNKEIIKAVNYFKRQPIIAVDTETNGLDPYTSDLFLIQISDPKFSMIVNFQKLEQIEGMNEAAQALTELLENPKILKLLQNAKFDYKFLKRHLGASLTNVYDTMLAEYLLTAGLKKEVNLQALTRKYTGAYMSKDARKGFVGKTVVGQFSDEEILYAAKDTFALFPIYTEQHKLLKEMDLMALMDLECECALTVAKMELKGVKIDKSNWETIIKEAERQRDIAAEAVIEELPAGQYSQNSFFSEKKTYAIKLNSPAQMLKQFQALGIKIDSTGDKILSKESNPVIKKFQDFRKQDKLVSGFGYTVMDLINKITQRLHPDFKQYGAETGRFSCAKPNVQQIPATSSFRACFVPEPGYTLVVCDYSQCELRILAELSSDGAFLTAFENNEDLHILAASQMFNVPKEDVTKAQRSQAKAINFGLAYGMGSQGLAIRIGRSMEEAKELIDAYFKAFWGIEKWLKAAAQEALDLGYTCSLMGRRRYFVLPEYTQTMKDEEDKLRKLRRNGIYDTTVSEELTHYRIKRGEAQRAGKNHPIQATNADMTKMALVFIDRELTSRGLRADIVNCVHDEVVVEVIEEEAELVQEIVEEAMLKAERILLLTVSAKADAGISPYWKK